MLVKTFFKHCTSTGYLKVVWWCIFLFVWVLGFGLFALFWFCLVFKFYFIFDFFFSFGGVLGRVLMVWFLLLLFFFNSIYPTVGVIKKIACTAHVRKLPLFQWSDYVHKAFYAFIMFHRFLQLKLLFSYFAKQVWSACMLYQQCRDRFSSTTLSIDLLCPTH